MWNDTLLPVTHVLPGPTLHAPAWHVSPSVHASPSLHVVPSLSLPSPGQLAPFPGHVSAVSQTPFAARHVVPAAYVRQAPAPLQTPSVPQLDAP
jgi:hypothetical protein